MEYTHEICYSTYPDGRFVVTPSCQCPHRLCSEADHWCTAEIRRGGCRCWIENTDRPLRRFRSESWPALAASALRPQARSRDGTWSMYGYMGRLENATILGRGIVYEEGPARYVHAGAKVSASKQSNVAVKNLVVHAQAPQRGLVPTSATGTCLARARLGGVFPAPLSGL